MIPAIFEPAPILVLSDDRPAEGARLAEIDREEIHQTRVTAAEERRVSEGIRMDVGDIPDRLSMRIDGPPKAAERCDFVGVEQ